MEIVTRSIASIAAAVLLMLGLTTTRSFAEPGKTPAFSIITIPGVTQVRPRAINDLGHIVGYADQPSGRQAGFIKISRFIDKIERPGDQLTVAWAINGRSEIVGSLVDAGVQPFGFLLSRGELTLFQGIGPRGLNDQGDIVGLASGGRDGFLLLHDGTFKILRVPDSNGTVANGINDRRQIVGDYAMVGSNQHGFVWCKTKFTSIEVPNSTFTSAEGINNLGEVVGFFRGSDPDDEQGFAWKNGKYIIIKIPGSVTTDVYGINDRGQIVGIYVAAGGAAFAFKSEVSEFED